MFEVAFVGVVGIVAFVGFVGIVVLVGMGNIVALVGVADIAVADMMDIVAFYIDYFKEYNNLLFHWRF